MIPEIFISLSGKDEEFAKQLYKALPHGLARIYRNTFQNGEALISEMEKGVERSSVLILIASHESLKSHWVNFELDLSRIGLIKKKIKIFIFPLESDIAISEYPKWMRDLWISPYLLNPKDIARTVQEFLFSDEFLGLGLYQDVIGRGGLLDLTKRHFLASTADRKLSPNVLIFSGTTQIGRRTFARHALKALMPGKPSLASGPRIDLPQFADLADIYRGLLDNVLFEAKPEDIERNLAAFGEASLEQKLDEIAALISYFSERDFAVYVYTGSGFFEEDGSTKEWLWPLIDRVGNDASSVLVLISNRRFREEEVVAHPNTLAIHVPALDDGDTSALVTSTATAYGIEPFTFSKGIVRAIGGHPGIAKGAVRLVASQGKDLVERQPQSIFNIQNFILSHNIDEANLSEIQLSVLYVLSWLPSLRGELLHLTVSTTNDNEDDFVQAIDELLLSCLIVINDEEYEISKELREIFRRKYGFGNEKLLQSLGEILSKEWESSSEDGIFDANLVDSLVFMHALAGKAIPDALRNVVLPSKFAEIIRTRYNQGRNDRETLEKITEWGEAILEMKADDTVQEEVLGIVIQSYVRLRSFDKADALLKKMGEKGYRSAPFLRGFRLRREGRLEEAIPQLRQAVHTRKNLRYSVQELATIFHSLGRLKDLNELLAEQREVVRDSAVLLDFEIGLAISDGDFVSASQLIEELDQLPQDDGRSTIRKAQIESQRWGNHEMALQMLDELVLGGIGEQVRTRRWRALFAAYARDRETAIRDIEFLSSKNDQEGTVERLKIHLAIAKPDPAEAERLSRELDLASSQNRALRARALELYSETNGLGLADKNKMREEVATLRASVFGGGVDV